jgi:hypothetical protein
MAMIRTKRGLVDCSSDNCGPHLKCFVIGEDKGTYVPGRGYTSYHKQMALVCWTRHLNGCPSIGKCPRCNTVAAPHIQGDTCNWCGYTPIERYNVIGK